MPKVLFYILNDWVFGKIHNELIKALYPDYYCDIFCWRLGISAIEADFLRTKYDFFVSTPEGCFSLHSQHGVPYSKLIAVAHGDWDIFNPIENYGVPRDEFHQLAGYAVICPLLVNISLSYSVGRVPDVLPIGVMCENYLQAPSTGIHRLGYFGAVSRNDNGTDIKRGHLAQRVAEAAELEFVAYRGMHFLITDQFYSHADLTIFCSLLEGNPYVVLESCAAGKPVLGTATGIFPAIAATGGGIVLPFDEEQFVAEAVAIIRRLQANFEQYEQMCAAARATSQQYDWSVIGPQWLKYFYKCSHRAAQKIEKPPAEKHTPAQKIATFPPLLRID